MPDLYRINPRYKFSTSQYNSDKVILKFKALQIQYSDSFTYFNCTLCVSLCQTLVFSKKTYHCKCYIKNILLVLFSHKVYLKALCILCILHLNYYSENSIVKDFCHNGHFFDIHVNSACCKAKPLLTMYIMSGQHKICPKCPSQANTGKAKQRTQKGLPPSRVTGLFLLRFTLINYAGNTAASSFRLTHKQQQPYSKLFSLNGHSSTTTQPRHNGLRALQILRPCQINQ